MTKMYHINRNGQVWIVAICNGIWHWLYPKATTGSCIR